MAHATHNTTRSQSGLAAWLETRVIDIRARLARRKVFRETFRELAALSDRELNDLGLNRTMIRRIAWQAAYEM